MGNRLRAAGRAAAALLEPVGIAVIVAGVWRYDEGAALIIGGLAVAVYGNLLRR